MTAKERRDAERIAGNLVYIRNADDDELARLLVDPTLDDMTRDMVRVEQAKREH